MPITEIFRKLYEGEISVAQATVFMDSGEAKEELITLFDKGVIPKGYYGVLE